MIPQFVISRESRALLKEMRDEWPKRLITGRALVVLDAAKIISETITRIDPDVNGLDYVKNLRVAVVSGVSETEAVALYYKSSTREIDLSDEDDLNSVLFFATTKDSPAWVNVMRKYHPWPAGLVPAKARKGTAKVISRRVSSREIQSISSKFYKNKSSIESELRGAGLGGAEIGNKGGDGTQVVDDIAYLALRAEFGMIPGGKPHWRPALKNMQGKLKSLGEKFLDYVRNGKESVFDLPQSDSLGAGALGEDEFQSKIVRSAT
jgi:hypothetical protein